VGNFLGFLPIGKRASNGGAATLPILDQKHRPPGQDHDKSLGGNVWSSVGRWLLTSHRFHPSTTISIVTAECFQQCSCLCQAALTSRGVAAVPVALALAW